MKKLQCLYLHGFASAFDLKNKKIITLSNFFEVIPFSYDTTGTFEKNFNKISNIVQAHKIDIIIGCSLGGFYALEVGAKSNVFAVALNPAFEPKISMQKLIGTNNNWVTDLDETLTAETVDTYPTDINVNPSSLVLIQDGDEVIDPLKSFEYFKPKCRVHLCKGGSHRFENIDGYIHFIHSNYTTSR